MLRIARQTARWFLALGLLPLLATPLHLEGQVAELTLSSTTFADGEAIPLRNSAYGENVSPAIEWSGAPAGTEAYALVMADRDVPLPGGFVHWVLYNIPASATGIPEGLPTDIRLTTPPELAGATQGLMGMRNPGYFGPRPPAGSGPHHYVFTVYALDRDLDLTEGMNRDQLMSAIADHILAQGSIVGVYTQN